jgi:two-component sensor histidine kinase
MRDVSDHIGTEERCGKFRATTSAARRVSWSMTGTAGPRGVADFEAVLLAIAGHDLRQPLQVIQSAHELLGHGIRTSSELRCLRSSQTAIDRLKEQLEQILTALRLRERGGRLDLSPVRIQQVLRQACRENERAALSKGISIHSVSSDATVLSDGLLLGAALRNLVSNAVKYTKLGGRVLLGCRRSGSEKFGSTCTIRALESPTSKYRESSKRSLGLTPHSARASASVSSSCGRRSEFWGIASTSPPVPVAGLAFPFSSGDPRRERTKPDTAQRETGSTREEVS